MRGIGSNNGPLLASIDAFSIQSAPSWRGLMNGSMRHRAPRVGIVSESLNSKDLAQSGTDIALLGRGWPHIGARLS